jgi:hypothetical protein
MILRKMIAALILCLICTGLTPAQTPSPSPSTSPNPNDPFERIKAEGLDHSELMNTLTYLTDVIGPRLNNSPGFRRASVWTRDKLSSWGLVNAHLEPWGPFGRGWSLQRFSAQTVAPQCFPLIAYPKAWSPPTNGELVSEVIYLDAKTEADLTRFKGKLKGKIVLSGPIINVSAHFEPLAQRWTDSDMLQFADDRPYPPNNGNFSKPPTAEQIAAGRFNAARWRFLSEENPALIISPSGSGDGGTILVGPATIPQPANNSPRLAPWQREAKTMPQIVMAVEHYNRLARMIQAGEEVKLAVDLAVKFYDDDLMSSHTIAEIPGSDLKDEVVMIGAHLDSWHAGTGATDNGAGVAVMMEAARIIQKLGLKPRRTIRVGLWGGEEVAGASRFYVRDHFAKKDSSGKLVTTSEYDKFSAYLNLDGGTGRIRGIFLNDNEALRPIFRPWLDPLLSLGVATLTINKDWDTDHVFFDEVGLPIVSFVQDDIEYETRTHHTNQDVLDRIQPDDLKQAAVVIAWFTYQIAMRDEKLPHRP